MDTEPPVESFLPLPELPHHILLALAPGSPLHGWGIIKRIAELSRGRSTPSSGSVYLAIGRLEDRGLVRRVDPPSDVDGRRRYYALEPLGRRVLAAESERLGHLVRAAREAGIGRAEP